MNSDSAAWFQFLFRCPSMLPLTNGCKPNTLWRLQLKCWTSMRSTSTFDTLYPNKVSQTFSLLFHLSNLHPLLLITFLFLSDLIAIPDFQSGAMENWGLTTYRETSLLYDPLTSSISDKLWVTMVIGHELAHQVRTRDCLIPNYIDAVL